MKNYIESLQWRYATKKYNDKKVTAEELELLKDAVQLSVSSLGLQPYRIVVIESQDVKEKLAEAASGNNKNIFKDASHLFIFANEVNVGAEQVDDFINNIIETRGVPREEVAGFGDYIKGYLDGQSDEQKNIWTAKQTYLALSTLINSAAVLKIDATPMEGFDAVKINEILELDKKGLNAVVVAAIGYRHDEDAMQHLEKVRKPKQELFITI
ncbi:NAD(P)H-dependent oxidoreductase [Flavobacterium rhizosphaerae]|uniref:NAD(P)H-dependent oxidoreductase n=1 Tax=Flavobacterium rhizosphaerae TaxID=3163298 RepID=A0ABW8YUR8_9FLAO